MSKAGDTVHAALAAGLHDAGTELIFGVPGGGPNLELIGACEDAGLRFVLAHAETAAAMMAATYAELVGVPGACLATRGPGAASMVNGVAHARLDRCPVVAVTDVVPHSERDRISHQLLDQRILMAAAAKASCTLGDGSAAEVAQVVACATAPPWGPVHVDSDPGAPTDTSRLQAAGPPSEVPTAILDRARRLLREARRPLLLAGVGARGAEQDVARFAEAHQIPVLATYKAKGVIDERDDLAAGLLTGATAEAPILAAADVILAVGVDPVELIPAPWPYAARVIAIGPWSAADAYLVPTLDLTGTVEHLLDALSGAGDGSGWGDTVAAHRRATLAGLIQPGSDDTLSPTDVILAARGAFRADTLVTVDAGAHMLPAMELWDVPGPRLALISSGLATMGFALPAAIAAALTDRSRPVVCFTGDGGLGMCLAELETLARESLDVTVVVLDDSRLSLIELKQQQGQGGAGAVAYRAMDFARIARAVGVPADRAHDPASLETILARMAHNPGPALVDAVIDPSAYRPIMAAIRGGSRTRGAAQVSSV
jgi:acetolactate synthase-1/2/3 large subunit